MRAEELAARVIEARARTLELLSDLTDEQLMGPRLRIVNPTRWEAGHVAWFQEHWVLRHARGRPPLHAQADALYDSSKVHHDTRWDLPLLSRGETIAYLRQVRDLILERLAAGPLSEPDAYFLQLSVFHEDMHGEAFTYTRQTLGLPAPPVTREIAAPPTASGPWPGDAQVPGGVFRLGSPRGLPFVFDNEKWEHEVEVRPFAIARAPVTQAEFAEFVEDGGYRNRALWTERGWAWREQVNASAPEYWRREGSGWARVDFDRLVPLEPHRPVIHVSWFEADAYCRWRGRRLPTEREWEVAAAGEPTADGQRLSERKRTYPWGEAPPTPERANLDWRRLGCVDVAALPDGDSAFGCRQMIGNVWEWTQDDFLPYPGFSPDPYEDYSQPWFGTHKVLRGGCWTTRSRLIRNAWRNFYTPDRRDVWAGIRTCAP